MKSSPLQAAEKKPRATEETGISLLAGFLNQGEREREGLGGESATSVLMRNTA
jgi:hypothetical protein